MGTLEFIEVINMSKQWLKVQSWINRGRQIYYHNS